MSNRKNYQLVGPPVPAEVTSSAPMSWGPTLLSILTIVFAIVAIGGAIGAIWFGVTAWQTNFAQDTRLLTGEIRTTNLETNLDTEIATRITEDALLQAQVDDRIASINQVHGDNVTHNVDLIVNGSGFTVTPLPSSHQVLLHNEAVLDINGVPPVDGSGTIFVEGTGMIDIISTANTSTILVDASSIVTSLSNLQMQVSMQQIEIMELQTNATTTQMVIDALVQSLMAGGNETNITAVIVELVANVTMAINDIATLQAQVANITMDAFQPGMLVPWTGAAGGPYPAGWLLCDGSEYEMSAYPELHAVVGTMYCPGPCSGVTKFAVPDMRGRTVVHKGGTALNTAIATVVGAETHTLTAAQMPFHQHGGSTNFEGAHQHDFNVFFNDNYPTVPAGFTCAPPYQPAVSTLGSCATTVITGNTVFQRWIVPSPFSSDGAHSHSFTTGGAGSGGAHNNIQPSMVMQYLIKT